MRKAFYFSPSWKCNENCLFCFVNSGQNTEEYTTEQAKKIIEEKTKEYNTLVLSGGEPTIRPDFFQLIEYGKECGYKSIEVLTNGVALSNEHFAAKLVATLKGVESQISISLHSHKEEVSNYLVAAKTFAYKLKGIKNLANNGFHQYGFYIVITSKNYLELEEYVEFVFQWFKPKWITFSFIFPQQAGATITHIFPKTAKVIPELNKALKLCKKYQIMSSISSCSNIPLCYIKGHEESSLLRQLLDTPESICLASPGGKENFQLNSREYHNRTKVKLAECALCKLNRFCPGIWKEYLEIDLDQPVFPVYDFSHLPKIKIDSFKSLKKAKDFNHERILCLNFEPDFVKKHHQVMQQFLKETVEQKRFLIFTKPLPAPLSHPLAPKNCQDCPDLFSLDQQKNIVLCNGLLAGKIGDFKEKAELLQKLEENKNNYQSNCINIENF